MSFTANNTGGLYEHFHRVGLLYGEYYGQLGKEIKGAHYNSSWKDSIKAGTGTYTYNGSAATSSKSISTAQYHLSFNTSKNINKTDGNDGYTANPPYIVVYFWRRTA